MRSSRWAFGTGMAVALGAVLCAAVAGGCSRTAVLAMPPPISFQRLPVPSVENAIVAGCMRRGWMPAKLRDGVFQATLHLRAHVAVVEIDYDEDSFAISYVRTENLRYSRRGDGVEVIHSNFNSWVRNLAADILGELGKMGISAGYLGPSTGGATTAPGGTRSTRTDPARTGSAKGREPTAPGP